MFDPECPCDSKSRKKDRYTKDELMKKDIYRTLFILQNIKLGKIKKITTNK